MGLNIIASTEPRCEVEYFSLTSTGAQIEVEYYPLPPRLNIINLLPEPKLRLNIFYASSGVEVSVRLDYYYLSPDMRLNLALFSID